MFLSAAKTWKEVHLTWKDLMKVHSRVRMPSPLLRSLTNRITRKRRKKVMEMRALSSVFCRERGLPQRSPGATAFPVSAEDLTVLCRMNRFQTRNIWAERTSTASPSQLYHCRGSIEPAFSQKRTVHFWRELNTVQLQRICFCQSASKAGSGFLPPYRPTGEEARRRACWEKKNLAILVRTHLHKHGTLIPESLHAESQWDRPKWVDQEVGRS